jgi:alkanesulfonate monooxygenase SsuD/methylene tetrahydromethanopterin reductase-like flavin-dependent oxidoreductase (luciferase family)
MHEEIEACGVDFGSRGRRADESIDVMRALWADESLEGVSIDGEFFSFSRAVSRPQPVSRSGVPIIIGGHSDAAARRAGRRGDGFQPIGVAGEELDRLLGMMRESAMAAGRDPQALEVSLGAGLRSINPDRMEALAATGANRVVASATGTVSALQEALDELSAAADRLGLVAPADR